MMFAFFRLVCMCLAFLALTAQTALAMAGEERIASKGEAVRGPRFTAVTYTWLDGAEVTTPATPWPKGVLEFANDPLRTEGWEFWFSECSNDEEHYDFVAKSPEDNDHLVRKFAAIKAKPLVIRLFPKFLWRNRLSSDPNQTAPNATFTIGNAQPPTLTLYLGDTTDLESLNIPRKITVEAADKRYYRPDHEGEPIIDAIDHFVAKYKSRQEQPR